MGVLNLTSRQEHSHDRPPVSPLRRRMIEDMTIRKFAPKTQEGYIRAVKNFSAFPWRSPDTGELRGRAPLSAASGVERRRGSDHQPQSTALRFLFMVTLERSEITDHMPFVREPRRLPVVLSPEEVARLLERRRASSTRRR